MQSLQLPYTLRTHRRGWHELVVLAGAPPSRSHSSPLLCPHAPLCSPSTCHTLFCAPLTPAASAWTAAKLHKPRGCGWVCLQAAMRTRSALLHGCLPPPAQPPQRHLFESLTPPAPAQVPQRAAAQEATGQAQARTGRTRGRSQLVAHAVAVRAAGASSRLHGSGRCGALLRCRRRLRVLRAAPCPRIRQPACCRSRGHSGGRRRGCALICACALLEAPRHWRRPSAAACTCRFVSAQATQCEWVPHSATQ